MLLHEATSFDVFRRRSLPSRSSRRTGSAVGTLLRPSPGAAQALACRRHMAGLAGARCGHLGPGRATCHRAISGATGWRVRGHGGRATRAAGVGGGLAARGPCHIAGAVGDAGGDAAGRLFVGDVLPRKKRCRGSALCGGRRRGRKATCSDPQNAGMIAPLYLSWMNFFTSGVCSAFTSFWMLASFARSLRAAMKLA